MDSTAVRVTLLLALSPAIAWAAPDAPDAGLPRTGPFGVGSPIRPNERTYALRPTPDGGYVYDDLRFQARVAPDGHVTFTDVRLRLDRPTIFGIQLKGYSGTGDARPSLADTLTKALRGDRKRPLPFTPHSRPPDAENLWAIPPPMTLPMGPSFLYVSGTFDLTDELMRATGQGWYRYEKAAFLSATFEFRVKLATERQRQLLREAITELPERLDVLWMDKGYTPREKRRILCLLWSEVDVGDSQNRAAAAVIIGWIRRHLPASSPVAYSVNEQAQCAAGVNRPFAVYDAGGEESTEPN